MNDVESPETYIGYDRAENFVSPGGAVDDARHVYSARRRSQLNEWGLSGDWTVGGEHARSTRQAGAIVFRFHARDLHLVLGPGAGRQAGPVPRHDRRRGAGRQPRRRCRR